MKERKYFQFFREWYEPLRMVSNVDVKCRLLEMVIDYSLYGKEVSDEDLARLEDIGRMYWSAVFPQIKNSRQHFVNGDKSNGAPKGSRNAAKFKEPTLDEIVKYFEENGFASSPECFFNYNEDKGWDACKSHFKTWKEAANRWEEKESGNKAKKPPKGVTLGVGEWIDENGERRYGSGRVVIPMDAQPRPGNDYCWDAHSQNWIVL